MPNELDDRLRSLGAHLDHEREAWAEAEASPYVATPHRGRSRLLLVAASFVLVAGVGGVLATRDHGRTPTTGVGTDVPALATAVPNVDATTLAMGLFPAGDLADVTSAGYATPQSAVDAYLADRTRTEMLPDGYGASYSVADRVVRTSDEQAIVGFSLMTSADSGDGLLLTRQVAPTNEPERWVVVQGGIGSFDIDELDYHDGRLTGSFSSGTGGRTEVSVRDAVTGELLGSSTDNPFTLDGLSSPAVSVRFWNTGDGKYPLAVFAEALVHDGEAVRALGQAALAPEYYAGMDTPAEVAPFVTGPISTFDGLSVGGTVSALNDGATTISVRLGDGDRSLCADIEFGDGLNGAVCFSRSEVEGQVTSFFNADSMDGTKVLVGGIVPDAITEIRTDTGAVIIPSHNVWWDVIDAGQVHTYTLTAADGRTIETYIG